MSALKKAVLDRKLVEPDDLAALEQWLPYTNASLAERLYRSGVVSDDELTSLFVSLGATDGTNDLVKGLPAPAALGALSRAMAERHRAIALRVEKARIVVAMLDPSDTTTLEKIMFFVGLAVEPRACRPRVLFQALHDAYGVPMVVPDAAFLGSRGKIATPSDDEERLPAPSPDVPDRTFLGGRGTTPVKGTPADPRWSPLAASVVAASSDEIFAPPKTDPLWAARDERPARSPSIQNGAELEAIRRGLPLKSPLEARDSLPPQVLRLLVPPLRTAVLFLVRDAVAVGWDGRTPTQGKDAIRDVLLPLTAPSAFERAITWKRVSLGNPADPTTIERILLQHLRLSTPSSFAVLPILVGEDVTALLYIDRADGALDDGLIASARSVGNTLADGLAPFVAARNLFPPVQHDRLPPIA